MTTRKRPADGHPVESRAQATLARPHLAKPREIVGLIHAINPTGRDFDTVTTERRYALKSRLQSMLIEHFRDELEFVLDPEQPGIVAIHHRYEGLDACHAMIAALDESARSWVQRGIDTGEIGDNEFRDAVRSSSDGARRTSQERTGAPEDARALMALGRAALAEYEFDSARTHFEAARALPGGDGAPVVALLELLVDHLAAYEEAIALGEGLSPAAASRTEVRALLAVAAARTGDRERVARLVRSNEDPRVADAIAEIAAHGIRTEQIELATQDIADLRVRAPWHSALARLDSDLVAARANDRLQLETRLEGLVAAGDSAGAEALARRIAAGFPESTVARGAIRDLADGRRAREAERANSLARESIAKGLWRDAEPHLAHARSSGADTRALDAEVRSLALREHHERVEAQAAALHATLANGQPRRRAIEAYVAASSEVRSRVRASVSDPVLSDVERLLEAGGAAGRACVDVVIEIEGAFDDHARGDTARVVERLNSIESMLVFVPRAKRLLQQSRGHRDAARHSATIELLDRAERAIDAGQLDEAAASLHRLDLAGALSNLRERADSLALRAATTASFAARLAAADESERDGRLTDARAKLEELCGSADTAAREGFVRRIAELNVRIREQFCSRVIDDEDSPLDVADVAAVIRIVGNCGWIADERDLIGLVSVEGPWFLVRFYDFRTRRVRKRMIFRTPVEMRDPVIVWCDGSFAVVSKSGQVLHVSTETGDVLAWRSLRDLIGPLGVIQKCIVVDPGKSLWVAIIDRTTQPRFVVVDVPNWRVVRNVQASQFAQTTGSRDVPLLLIETRKGVARLMDDRGEVRLSVRYPQRVVLHGSVVHPSRDGLLTLSSPTRDGTFGRGPLTVSARFADGKTIDGPVIRGAYDDSPVGCGVAIGENLLLVLYDREDGVRHIAGIAIESDSLRELWRIACPRETMVVGVSSGRELYALIPTDGEIITVLLTRTPPVLPAIAPVPALVMPKVDGASVCHDVQVADADPLLSVRESYLKSRASRRPDWLPHLLETHAESAADLVSIAYEALASGDFDRPPRGPDAETMPFEIAARFALTRHESDPSVLLLVANLGALERNWAQLLTVLRKRDPGELPPLEYAHFYHLLGLACMHSGLPDEARRAFRAGATVSPNRCGFDRLLPLVEPLCAPTEQDLGVSQPLVPQLIALAREADRRLALHDYNGVIELLHRSSVLASGELQCFARLARAWESKGEIGAAASFHRARAFARVATGIDPDVDLLFAGAWSREAMNEAVRRARIALGEKVAD